MNIKNIKKNEILRKMNIKNIKENEYNLFPYINNNIKYFIS
jgi:hypothetical protein